MPALESPAARAETLATAFAAAAGARREIEDLQAGASAKTPGNLSRWSPLRSPAPGAIPAPALRKSRMSSTTTWWPPSSISSSTKRTHRPARPQFTNRTRRRVRTRFAKRTHRRERRSTNRTRRRRTRFTKRTHRRERPQYANRNHRRPRPRLAKQTHRRCDQNSQNKPIASAAKTHNATRSPPATKTHKTNPSPHATGTHKTNPPMGRPLSNEPDQPRTGTQARSDGVMRAEVAMQ